ncbi:MAG TPA: hypothetical protein VHA33_06350 [Candidatus Angelobacter sp.]|jgi:hypothetical protein|nr:hypothetical protein [Candidatus Angelobacter sp.]
MTQNQFISKRLRAAGILIMLGLLVEALSLIWNHPLSFVAFLGIGGLMMFAGIIIYLVSLVSDPR